MRTHPISAVSDGVALAGRSRARADGRSPCVRLHQFQHDPRRAARRSAGRRQRQIGELRTRDAGRHAELASARLREPGRRRHRAGRRVRRRRRRSSSSTALVRAASAAPRIGVMRLPRRVGRGGRRAGRALAAAAVSPPRIPRSAPGRSSRDPPRSPTLGSPAELGLGARDVQAAVLAARPGADRPARARSRRRPSPTGHARSRSRRFRSPVAMLNTPAVPVARSRAATTSPT